MKASDPSITKRVLVTGGAGFLGTNLCKKLLEVETNYVYCLDNLISGKRINIRPLQKSQRFTFIEMSVTEPLVECLNHIVPCKIDEIYHMACIASPPAYKKHAIDTLNTSYIGTKNVLDLARHHECKLLFTSTSEVYGDPHVHPQPEEYFGNVNTVGERSCYDEGKRVAETLMYEYRRAFSLDLKIVRLFNTYGPYMDIHDGRVITNFIKAINTDRPLVVYGDGTQGRSFCYVDDMIRALMLMMDSHEQGPINLGNPYNEFTLNELIEKFREITPKDIAVQYIDPVSYTHSDAADEWRLV